MEYSYFLIRQHQSLNDQPPKPNYR